MDVVHERCTGIDISKTDVKVCIRVPGQGKRRRKEVRTFTTMTKDLLVMRDWLLAERVPVAGMEATGPYSGQRDPAVLAELALGSMRGKRPLLSDALTGRFAAHHAFMARVMLDRIDACVAAEERLSQQIDVVVAPFRRQLDLIETAPGVGHRAAEVILAEVGTDMSRITTGAHLASWAGMCPGNHQSGGTTKAVPTRHGDPGSKPRSANAPTPPAARAPTWLPGSNAWLPAGARNAPWSRSGTPS